MQGACRLPDLPVTYIVKKNVFSVSQPVFTRTTAVFIGEAAAPYTARIRLVDVSPGGSPHTERPSLVCWEVGLIPLDAGSASPAITGDHQLVMLDVRRFQLQRSTIVAAPQLALLRHLWVSRVLEEYPGASGIGGQHRWEDAWWNEIPAKGEA
ncbi:MAG: hypothetical protein QG671_2702 [Actinomycetota bacterium]|jgi:hypothetical protein|nr:hypothetical protein [Actinomycetota bacterium]